MSKQTEQFLNALKDIEEGKIVSLDKALNEKPPSKELQKIYNDIDQIDGEREAWKRMFDLQSKLVMNLELDKIKLEKEIKGLKKEVQMYKDILRLSDHLYKERLKDKSSNKMTPIELKHIKKDDVFYERGGLDWYSYKALSDAELIGQVSIMGKNYNQYEVKVLNEFGKRTHLLVTEGLPQYCGKYYKQNGNDRPAV